MRIVQLTDIHLDLVERYPYDTDVWGNFERALHLIERLTPDLLVVSGDIALHHGSLDVYREVAVRCARLAGDVLYLPGNHDDRSLFAAAFGRRYRLSDAHDRLDRVVRLAGYPLLLIDSADGLLSERQLGWIEQVLEAHSQGAANGALPTPLPVFIHHPVLTGFHRYMDAQYALENAAEAAALLARYAAVQPHLFCGHYHCEHRMERDGVIQFTTPSTYCNTELDSHTFALDHNIPAVREIRLARGNIETRVHYAPTARAADAVS